MCPNADISSTTAMMPSSATSTGNAISTAIAAGVNRRDGSTWNAASSASAESAIIAIVRPRPTACRRCPWRQAPMTASTRPSTTWTAPSAIVNIRNGASAFSRSKASGRMPKAAPSVPKNSPNSTPNTIANSAQPSAISATARTVPPGRERQRTTAAIAGEQQAVADIAQHQAEEHREEHGDERRRIDRAIAWQRKRAGDELERPEQPRVGERHRRIGAGPWLGAHLGDDDVRTELARDALAQRRKRRFGHPAFDDEQKFAGARLRLRFERAAAGRAVASLQGFEPGCARPRRFRHGAHRSRAARPRLPRAAPAARACACSRLGSPRPRGAGNSSRRAAASRRSTSRRGTAGGQQQDRDLATRQLS